MEKMPVHTGASHIARLLCLVVFLLSFTAFLPAQKKQSQNNPMQKTPMMTPGAPRTTNADRKAAAQRNTERKVAANRKKHANGAAATTEVKQ
jgi:hypothetical protein